MEETMSTMSLPKPTGTPISSFQPSNRVGSPPQQHSISQASSPSKNSPSDSAKITAMANGLSLESLPLEVIHQIFSLLIPHDLASLRLTSHTLCSSATANSHWRHHFAHSLLPSHAALMDVASVPSCAWSFSCAPDGWFRAYTALIRIAKEGWLHSDNELKGTMWMVLFKAFLREGGAVNDDPNYHTIIEMKVDCTTLPLEGLPLNISSWHVDKRPSLRFPCYPPNMPSRDPFTWCRVLQHVSVLMITDSPDLLEGLIALNSTILDEVVASQQLCAEKRKVKEKELQDHIDVVLENRRKGFSDRLKRLHILRSERQEKRNIGSPCSNVELPEIPTGENTLAGAPEEESDWTHENEDDEWSDEGGEYSYIFEEFLFFQHFQQQHTLQNSTLAASPITSEGSELDEQTGEEELEQ